MNKFRESSIIKDMPRLDTSFLINNSHWEDVAGFQALDPHLGQMKTYRHRYEPPLLSRLPSIAPGLYTLSGTYRTGKTTLLKTWMSELLTRDIVPQCIVYIAGELIHDYHALNRLLLTQLGMMPTEHTRYLILDDINEIRDWYKGLLPLMEQGKLEHMVLLLSGSDMALSDQAEQYFPTLRSKRTQYDFQLFPLSFREVVTLKQQGSEKPPSLFDEFNQYLIHGGFLHVINEVAVHKQVTDKTLYDFADWMIGTLIDTGRQEAYVREIFTALLKHYHYPITWNLLAQELTIDHPKTIGDYFQQLERMGVVFIQPALLEETLQAAPKKARKTMFTDPFIFHAIRSRFLSGKQCYESQIKPCFNDSELYSMLAKSCAITQYARFYPTYYIKAEGEVDIAYVEKNRICPIEMTWTGQMRAKDLKQILKYQSGRILTKTDRSGIIEHIKTEPLPIALWQMNDTQMTE